MFSYLRLLDGTIVVGMHVSDTDDEHIFENLVEVGRKEYGNIESRFHFAGMHCPFVEGNPLVVSIKKHSVISLTKNLDPALESHYNKFIQKWFEARDNYFGSNNGEEDDEDLDEPSTVEEIEEAIDRLQAMLHSANNTLH